MCLPVDHFMVVTRDEMKVLTGLELEKAAKKLLKANMTLTQQLFLLKYLDLLIAVEALIATVAIIITVFLRIWSA